MAIQIRQYRAAHDLEELYDLLLQVLDLFPKLMSELQSVTRREVSGVYHLIINNCLSDC